MLEQTQPLTEESIKSLLEQAGARVMSRGGRTENYGSPREFSFEVKGVFSNGMGLHVVARQYNYRDPWEAEGRVNDVVDVALLKDKNYSELPKGFDWFQGRDEEIGVDEKVLAEIISIVVNLNPKLFKLQELTGDM